MKKTKDWNVYVEGTMSLTVSASSKKEAAEKALEICQEIQVSGGGYFLVDRVDEVSEA